MDLPRFRFADFVLSPKRRLLVRQGVAVPLIPKYFDLLVMLVVRRREAVAKQTIFDEIWTDVVVSDGALAQAVRTLRRTLGDDSREPRFIRTVSRHGYQFVYEQVQEEGDDGELVLASQQTRTVPFGEDPLDDDLDRLVERFVAASSARAGDVEDARDLAERLHALGTDQALARVTSLPNHARLIALLRDTRWNVPRAGDVPLLSNAEGGRAIAALVKLRLLDARRAIARRWASAAASGIMGGALAGLLGGLLLSAAPGSTAHLQSSLALAAIGAAAGGIGAAGLAAGIVTAEAVARSQRALALIFCAASGGAITATIARVVAQALLIGLVNVRLPDPGGAIDGLVLGAAAGAGFAIATPQARGGGLAAPAGIRRLYVVALVAAACALGGVALSLSGRLLIGGLVHEIARASRDADLVLAPLGHLIGEPGFGPLTRLLVSAFEGAVFGASLAWGLTHRP